MGASITDQNGALVIRPDGPSVCDENYQDLHDAFSEAMLRKPGMVILDLECIEYLDSVGLGSILAGKFSLSGTCEVCLCGLKKRVRALLHGECLESVFRIYDSVDSAIASAT